MSPPMRKATELLIAGLLALALGAGCSTTGEKPYVETTGRKGWHWFLHPAKKSPVEQLRYADELLGRGREKAALKQYYALTVFWPEAAQAGQAQYQYASYFDRKGKLQKAFDEYQRLVQRYAGTFPYDEVLGRQFDIATNLMYRKKGHFLFFPGFSAPERAVPLFQAILTNAPQWEKAAEASYLAGLGNELALQYEEAIAAYMTTLQRYPESPFAARSAFGAAQCYFRLAKESPQNDLILENAWAALTLFLNNYPQAEQRAKAEEYRKSIFKQRSQLAYNEAYYYDRIARKPKAALQAYRNLEQQFPHSEWTSTAQKRIEELSAMLGKNDDDKKTDEP